MEFTQFGKYLLLHKIAVGGMAEIFLAKQGGIAGFEKLVVIKRILADYAKDPELVKMFLDEARLAASMMHPNVAQVFDLDRVDTTLYIAMEYIPGQDLEHILRACRLSRGGVPPPLLARILASACEGLHYAHTLKDSRGLPLNLVHRDVTPSNLLIAYEGATKILDFGVAKAESHQSKTAAGKLKGKYPYMAPEQILGEALDGRVDVWALGVVLWEALTMRRLFNADNELGIMRAILESPIPHPGAFNPDAPVALQAIAMRALQRGRDRRYPTAQAMQLELEAYLRTLNTPATTLDVSSFVKQLFAAEFLAHEHLLSEVPHATDAELASLVRRAEPKSSPSHSGVSDVVTGPQPEARRKLLAGMAAVGATAFVAGVAAVIWALTRPAVDRRPAQPAPTATVVVVTEPPGANIYFDGARQVPSPMTVPNVAANVEHTIIADKDGFEVGSKKITVGPRGTREVVLHLVAKGVPAPAAAPTVKVAAVSRPPGAQVIRADSGEVLGVTPVDRVLASAADPVVLRFELKGFEPQERKITLDADVALEVTLKPSSKRPAKKTGQEASADGIIDPF